MELKREKLPGRRGRKGHCSVAAEGEGGGKHGTVGSTREPCGGGVIPTSAGPASGRSSVVGVGSGGAGDAGDGGVGAACPCGVGALSAGTAAKVGAQPRLEVPSGASGALGGTGLIGERSRWAKRAGGGIDGSLEKSREALEASGLPRLAEIGSSITQGTSGGPVIKLEGARRTPDAGRLAPIGLVLSRLASLANCGRRGGLIGSIGAG